MQGKLIRLWDRATKDERFAFMLELDKRFRGNGEIGNGLRNFRYALVTTVEKLMEKGKDNAGL